MAFIDTHAKAPGIRPAYKTVVAYINSHSGVLTALQTQAATELKRRLRRLENECSSLIRLNNLLLDSDGMKISFDEATGVLTTTMKGVSQSLTISRADPAIPVKVGQPAVVQAYHAGVETDPPTPENIDTLRQQLEQMIEGYYYNAFLITKLAQKITGRKYECREITIVRNKLVEHFEGVSIYSFGIGSSGPVVKPIQIAPATWNDAGLVHNTTALVNSLNTVFASAGA
jgi:hypothetical protein